MISHNNRLSIQKRFTRVVIYLNLPLWVAVGILAFAFGQWDVVKILVGCNIVLLLTSYIWYLWAIILQKG